MAKNKKYIVQEFVDLEKVYKKHKNLLIGDFSELKDLYNEISSENSMVFRGNEDDIKGMLSTSKKMKDLLTKHKNRCKKLKESIEKLAKNSEDIKNNYAFSDTEFKDRINRISKLDKNRKEVKNINEKIHEAQNNKDTELENRLKARRTSISNENKKIISSFNNSTDKRDKDFYKDYKNNSNIALYRYISSISDVNKLTSSIKTNQDDINDSINEGAEGYAKQKKIINGIEEALKSAFGIIEKGYNKWEEIDEKVFTVGRQIGFSSTQLRGYQENILTSYDNLASKLGMTFSELFKFQEQYTKNTGRAIVLSNEQVSTLGAMSKLVGDVATNDMVKNMDDFGASTQTATSYLALNMARARNQGLDAQKASETFANNVKLASKYNFKEGVNGISKMTLLSQKLKFNMDSITNAAEKFETIEGAIGNAANLQMLGGSYAAQFGNPLEAMNMAMLDMEGFTNKIIDTFSGKAIFNRETGQVEMSAIDKRLMKEAAKQLGISYDEAWNIASQKAKISDVERNLNPTESFTEDEKAFITSKTQYIDGKHQITYFDKEGKQRNVEVGKLTKEQLDIMRNQEDAEHAIQGDVHGIHGMMQAYIHKQMGDSRSWNEMKKGLQESAEINIANIWDLILNPIKNWFHSLSENNSWIKYGLFTTVSAILVKAIQGGFSNVLGRLADVMGKGVSNIPNLFGNLKGLFRGQGNSNSGRNIFGGVGSKIKNGANWALKNGLKLVKNPYVWGATALIGGGLSLMSAADGSQVDKSKLGGREVEPNDIEPTNVEKTEELTELEKQTVLLKAIADKQGVDTSKILDLSHVKQIDTTQEAGTSEMMLSMVASSYGDKIYKNQTSKALPSNIQKVNEKLGNKINSSFIGKQYENRVFNKALKAEEQGIKLIEKGKTIGGREGAKLILKGRAKKKLSEKLTTKAIGGLATRGLAGPAGLAGMAIDTVNFGGQALGLWEEGSHTDKLMNIGAKTASYAGIGAMIAGPIGAAVGGAVGLVSGTIQQYGKEIKEFGSKVYNGVKDGLFGSDNMTESDKIQQQYEETKIGIVDIRDPQLEQKAQLATCQIHDIVVSMWHHMNGKQSNGLEKNKGLFGGVAKGLFNTTNDVNSNVYTNNETLLKQHYNSSLYDNILVKDIKYNNVDNVTSKPTVGEPTHIRKTVEYNSSLYNNSNSINNKLDLNVSGTIKLTTDRSGNSIDIDLNKLLSNSEFVSKLTEVITNRLSENANGGRLDKNSFKTITHSSGRKEVNG